MHPLTFYLLTTPWLQPLIHHVDFSVIQPPSPVPGILVLPSEIGTHYDSEEARYYTGFNLPPLDLDLLNMVLENDLVPEPTAEVAASK